MGNPLTCKTKRYPSKVICFILLLMFLGCADRSAPGKNFFSFQYDVSLSRKQIVLIFPGMGQKVSKPEYHTIGGYYKSKGITPVYVDMNWSKTGLNNLSIAAAQIGAESARSFPDSHIYLFGFSFGAVMAYKVSETITTEQTLLCSMSPVFDEDRKYQIFPFRQMMGLVTDYSTNNLSYAHNEGRCFIFIYGAHDSFLINKSIIEHRQAEFKCNKSKIVENAGHDISKPAYLEGIKDIIAGNS